MCNTVYFDVKVLNSMVYFEENIIHVSNRRNRQNRPAFHSLVTVLFFFPSVSFDLPG